MELKPRHWYKFSHKRKGTFVAQYRKKTEGDDVDPFFWEVQIPVMPGSGQEGMATVVNAPYRFSGLRPSLVGDVEEIERPEWLKKKPPSGGLKGVIQKVTGG